MRSCLGILSDSFLFLGDIDSIVEESESIHKHDLVIPRNIGGDTTQENGTVGVQ